MAKRNQQLNKESRAKAAAAEDAVAKSTANDMIERFEDEASANAALASAAKVINMKEAAKAKEAKMTKSAEKTTKVAAPKEAKVTVGKDGRTKLPPMPRAKAKPKPAKPCECGCGGLTRARFVPGHDSRMRGWILRVERGIVKLSEIPDGERQAVARELKLRQTKDGKSAAAGE